MLSGIDFIILSNTEAEFLYRALAKSKPYATYGELSELGVLSLVQEIERHICRAGENRVLIDDAAGLLEECLAKGHKGEKDLYSWFTSIDELISETAGGLRSFATAARGEKPNDK